MDDPIARLGFFVLSRGKASPRDEDELTGREQRRGKTGRVLELGVPKYKKSKPEEIGWIPSHAVAQSVTPL